MFAIAIGDLCAILSHFHFTQPLHLLLAENGGLIDLNVPSTVCAHSNTHYYEKRFELP